MYCTWLILGGTVFYAVTMSCFCIIRYPRIDHFYQLFHHPGDFVVFVASCMSLPLAVISLLRRPGVLASIAVLVAVVLLVAAWPPPTP